jgi:pimeloyl-ACP methyl ester carboxylesterase
VLLCAALQGCKLPHEVVFPAPQVILFPLLPGGAVIQEGQGDQAFVALHRPASPGSPTVVWLHGNGQQIGDLPRLLHALSAGRLGIYAVEYPSYGLLDGPPSEERTYASVDAALRWLHGPLETPPERVVLVGQSLGTGVAAEMALRGHGARLALLSPFTSTDDVAEGFAGRLGVWLLPDHFPTARKAPRIDVPVLILHGTRDRVIPGWMAQELEGRFPRAALFWVAGAGHNDLFQGRRGEGVLSFLRLFAEAPLGDPAAVAQK